MEKSVKVYIGIGSNMGDRMKNIRKAVGLIGEHIGAVEDISGIYESEPWGFESSENFLNMVLAAGTELSPAGVLGRVLFIESAFGRVRGATRYVPRLIDIDILFYGSEIINAGDLIIPHPLLHKRLFVLVPLCEIAAGLVHPVYGRTVKELLDECPDTGMVVPYH